MRQKRTAAVELDHVRLSIFVIEAFDVRAARDLPFGSQILAVFQCPPFGRRFSEILTIMRQSILGHLDWVVISTGFPLRRHRHTCPVKEQWLL